jgi:hypothetical protein
LLYAIIYAVENTLHSLVKKLFERTLLVNIRPYALVGEQGRPICFETWFAHGYPPSSWSTGLVKRGPLSCGVYLLIDSKRSLSSFANSYIGSFLRPRDQGWGPPPEHIFSGPGGRYKVKTWLSYTTIRKRGVAVDPIAPKLWPYLVPLCLGTGETSGNVIFGSFWKTWELFLARVRASRTCVNFSVLRPRSRWSSVAAPLYPFLFLYLNRPKHKVGGGRNPRGWRRSGGIYDRGLPLNVLPFFYGTFSSESKLLQKCWQMCILLSNLCITSTHRMKKLQTNLLRTFILKSPSFFNAMFFSHIPNHKRKQ